MNISIILSTVLLSLSFGFVPPVAHRRRPAAFSTSRLFVVVTGPEGNAASSAEEDLELTFQVISSFIHNDDDDDVLDEVEEVAEKPAVDKDEDFITEETMLETVGAAATVEMEQKKVLEEIEASIPSSVQTTLPKRRQYSDYKEYAERAGGPHINSHLFSLSPDDTQEKIIDTTLYDDSFLKKGGTSIIAVKEKDVAEEDVLKAASDFFAGDIHGSDNPKSRNNGKNFYEKKKDITGEDVMKAAADFFSEKKAFSDVLDNEGGNGVIKEDKPIIPEFGDKHVPQKPIAPNVKTKTDFIHKPIPMLEKEDDGVEEKAAVSPKPFKEKSKTSEKTAAATLKPFKIFEDIDVSEKPLETLSTDISKQDTETDSSLTFKNDKTKEKTRQESKNYNQHSSSSSSKKQSPSPIIIVHGNSLRTCHLSSTVRRIKLYLRTNGRPLNTQVELWQGPDNTPQTMTIKIENGKFRPFYTIVETPGFSKAVAVRNLGGMAYPIAVCVEPDVKNKGTTSTRINGSSGPRTIQGGGAVHSRIFDSSVQSIQLMLETKGLPLQANIELLQGPNNQKQVMEVYSEDGLTRPFVTVIETPSEGGGGTNVVRIVNKGPLEFPLSASIDPYVVETERIESSLETVWDGGDHGVTVSEESHDFLTANFQPEIDRNRFRQQSMHDDKRL